jgi:hypothetical protein
LVGLGCASRGLNLVGKGDVSIELVRSKEILIPGATVVQKGDELVISGKVKRRNSRLIHGGHIDIAIIGPDGETLEHVSTPHIPRIIPRKGTQSAFFTVRLPNHPDSGSIVRVAYHSPKESRHDRLDCGDNAACPKR